ncbi:MAG TPA: hypothetical protein VLS45_02290, partial [Methylomicrobium sp.]|nr:hypothetical protein [Methylomicrobium sp.]
MGESDERGVLKSDFFVAYPDNVIRKVKSIKKGDTEKLREEREKVNNYSILINISGEIENL